MAGGTCPTRYALPTGLRHDANDLRQLLAELMLLRVELDRRFQFRLAGAATQKRCDSAVTKPILARPSSVAR